MRVKVLCFALLVALSDPAPAWAQYAQAPGCTWEAVAAKYRLNPYLLFAIAKTESGLKPLVKSKPNADGSYDIGLMQINSSWLPKLSRYGITEASLYDSCINLDVGAWILAENMGRLGNTWNAVGAYNAKSPDKRVVYARKVLRNIPMEAFNAAAQ